MERIIGHPAPSATVKRARSGLDLAAQDASADIRSLPPFAITLDGSTIETTMTESSCSSGARSESSTDSLAEATAAKDEEVEALVASLPSHYELTTSPEERQVHARLLKEVRSVCEWGGMCSET